MITTEEFFKRYSDMYCFEEGDPEYLIDKETFKQVMIEFAKSHVTAALESAANNAEIYKSETDERYDGVDKDSILNCYPDNLIK